MDGPKLALHGTHYNIFVVGTNHWLTRFSLPLIRYVSEGDEAAAASGSDDDDAEEEEVVEEEEEGGEAASREYKDLLCARQVRTK
jgi:hypothetical protein